MTQDLIRRRHLLALGGAAALSGLAAPAFAQQFTGAIDSGRVVENSARAQRNTQSFRTVNWQSHFSSLRNGAILADTASRAVHYWSEDQQIYLLYPCSVPMTEDFTRRGRTSITAKRFEPTWIPTANMRQRDPTLPTIVHPGPDNPLGTRALNLGWQYYRIHGIDNPAKIGRKASNGCFGLYNHHVEYLYELTRVGTQVVVI
jgi:lipoprotein-anchoring transpeptidase ErfK/SrfK